MAVVQAATHPSDIQTREPQTTPPPPPGEILKPGEEAAACKELFGRETGLDDYRSRSDLLAACVLWVRFSLMESSCFFRCSSVVVSLSAKPVGFESAVVQPH